MTGARSIPLAAVALVMVLAGPAGRAPVDVWREAGEPHVLFVNDPAAPGGSYRRDGDGPGMIVLNLAPGTNVALWKTLLHELGHAWADRQGVDLGAYGRVRGFPAGTPADVLREDYAEAFQTVACDCWPHTGETPYGFHAGAGVPSVGQVAALTRAGILPAGLAKWGAAKVDRGAEVWKDDVL